MLITLPGVSSLTYYKLRTRPCHTLVQHLPWVLIACKIKSNIFIYLEIKKWASTYGWCVISCHLLSTFSVPNTLHPHHKMVQDSHCQNTWFYAAWHCSLHILATFKMVIFFNHTPRIQIQKCPVGPRNPFLSWASCMDLRWGSQIPSGKHTVLFFAWWPCSPAWQILLHSAGHCWKAHYVFLTISDKDNLQSLYFCGILSKLPLRPSFPCASFAYLLL